MDEGPHTRPDVECDQINQFVKAGSRGASEGNNHPAHPDVGEAGSSAKAGSSTVATDQGAQEGGGKREGNGAHPAGAVRAMEGAPHGASGTATHLNGAPDTGRVAGNVKQESQESRPQGVGASAAVPMSESSPPLTSEPHAAEAPGVPTVKDERSQSAQPGESQPAPPAADMSVTSQEDGMQVDGASPPSTAAEEPLPPPSEPPATAPCLKGKLYQAADGRHVCKGLWAMKRELHDLEGDDLVAVTNKFEFSCMPPDRSTPLPMHGQYQGFFWMTLKKLAKFDDTCNLHFTANSAGGWNITGSGYANKCGSYQISGTVSSDMNLELFRLFDHLIKGKPGATTSSSKSRKSTGGSKKAPPPPRPPQQPRLASLHLHSDASVGADSTVSHLTESTSFARPDVGSASVLGLAVGVSKAGRMIKTKLPPGYEDEKVKPDKLTAKCLDIVTRLMKHPAAYLFNQPVDPVRDQCPDYFQVITNPMDFGTIKIHLENLVYPSPEVFADDVRLVFQNAVRYNPRPEHYVHMAALQLSQVFEDRFSTVFPPAQQYSDDEALLTAAGYAGTNGRPSLPGVRRSLPSGGMGGGLELSELGGDFMDEDLPFAEDMEELNYDELADTPIELPRPKPAAKKSRAASYGGAAARRSGGGAGRKSTPGGGDAATKALLQRIEALEKEVKAKNSGEQRRILTYEDKKKLSKSIETLAPDKAAKVVKIIQSRMDLSMANSNEVEIDIDTLPNDTLLELQAYVNKCNQPKRAGAPMKGPEGKKRKTFGGGSWGGDSEDDWTDDES